MARPCWSGLVAGLWLTTVSGALASDPVLGTLSADLDGMTLRWQTLADGDGGAAGSTGMTPFDALFAISLRGYPEVPPRGDGLGVLVVGFAVARDGHAATDARIRYHPDDFSAAYVSAPGDVGVVTLDRFDPRDRTAAGRFAARLCWRPDAVASPDLTRCRDIDGWFDSAVPLSR